MTQFDASLFYYFVLMFMLFSVAGWCMEVVLKLIQFHRFINRGFLIGPYCPIYGTGSVLITCMVHLIAGTAPNAVEAFLISFFFCGALEYFSSWYMEKVFHARWWDYSHKPMNLDGRIWIGNLILFGIGGVIIVKLAAPFLFDLFSRIPEKIAGIISIICVLLMLTDYVVSHIVTGKVRIIGEASIGDNTEEISREIRRILSSGSFLQKRIINAYPHMQARTKSIQKRLREEHSRVKERVSKERQRIYDYYNHIK